MVTPRSVSSILVADDVLDKLTVSGLEHRVRVSETWGEDGAREAVARCAIRWAARVLDDDELLALVGELMDSDEGDG